MTIKVGVIGYVNEKFDKVDAWKLVRRGLETVKKQFSQGDFEIVSNLVNEGVPQTAYIMAGQREWPTVGIAPEAVLSQRIFPCDTMRKVGTKWGDEVGTFLESIDVLVSVGRNASTKVYVAEAKKRGISVHEYKLDYD